MWTRRLCLLPVLALVSGCVAGEPTDDPPPAEGEPAREDAHPVIVQHVDEPPDACVVGMTYVVDGRAVEVPVFCAFFYMDQGDPPPDVPAVMDAQIDAINPPVE